MNREQVKKFLTEIEYGYVCELCHLSDWGANRLRQNNFKVVPCKQCKQHFGRTN